ncbi:hypothetical protein GJ496_006465 [Pomphorhynchus laevis]|nr:hypothetical protein GJ496_006465 [Pomphorhynchus laevis]
MLDYDGCWTNPNGILTSEVQSGTDLSRDGSNFGISVTPSEDVDCARINDYVTTEKQIQCQSQSIKITYSPPSMSLLCPNCNAEFSGKARNKELTKHLTDIHSNSISAFVCPKCLYENKTPSGIALHFRQCSRRTLEVETSMSQQPSDTPILRNELTSEDSADKELKCTALFDNYIVPFPQKLASSITCPCCCTLLTGRAYFQLLFRHISENHPSITLTFKCSKCDDFQSDSATSIRAHAARCKIAKDHLSPTYLTNADERRRPSDLHRLSSLSLKAIQLKPSADLIFRTISYCLFRNPTRVHEVRRTLLCTLKSYAIFWRRFATQSKEHALSYEETLKQIETGQSNNPLFILQVAADAYQRIFRLVTGSPETDVIVCPKMIQNDACAVHFLCTDLADRILPCVPTRDLSDPGLVDVPLITSAQLSAVISKISKATAVGPDKVSVQQILRFDPRLHILSLITNMILQAGYMPRTWRCNKSVLVPKKGKITASSNPSADRHDIANYRPITMSSVLCRIHHRLILGLLQDYDSAIFLRNTVGLVCAQFSSMYAIPGLELTSI